MRFPEGSVAYLLIMSGGCPDIKVDPDEIGKVQKAIATGTPCKLRQAMFNPSFWIATVEDADRNKEERRKWREGDSIVERKGQYVRLPYAGMKPLKDIFSDMIETKNSQQKMIGH